MLKEYQKKLRKNLTEAEIYLWTHLRNRRFHGFKFRRQQILRGFIVDFVCFEKKLIIELDGGQHSEQEKYDRKRTNLLEEEGFHVLRFWNHEVMRNREDVLETIYQILLNKV
ncbi:endonuclease domain-containing protein [Aquicella lusitana]|uniref:Very-short-patch-repair endonuclease n=1 Tax=Aquicella lusitana TaxID=254246 RepID=A0A370GDC9_9COXI|nr:DUF559 domain-containing protein [Aquicella lusitana]RDI41697.1 very-short-patch-repair endonuclease [Aquicella lusitana]VVC72673.1 hypothetical protein AQULUS_03870 [Aquicella lusitana]